MRGPLALSAPPLAYLHTYGPRADPVTDLMWFLIWLSMAVVAIVAGLVVAGVMVRGIGAARPRPAVVRGKGGVAWIVGGVALTVVALTVALVRTVAVLVRTDSPAVSPPLAIEVIGHQWWWEVRYPASGATPAFATANEIHVPVAVPVLVRLASADVIHSFWAPALTGKTDTIPGRTNITWFQADRPGFYAGACTEYCGLQHAHMALAVVAQPAADFARWRARQGQQAVAAEGPGAAVFGRNCASCHAVRGTVAHGQKGPDLTHLMSRATIAAGLLLANGDALAGWIANPQALKPGTKMPATHLSGPELNAVTSYLRTLK